MALCSLHHVIDLDWMKEAYRLTRKDGAPGIDGVTAADYEVNLETRLLDLLERIKSGRYRAPPVRRAYIPKADGSQRMLGIPTFEDKVAQRAITMVLETVYEEDFYPCSYGFRPGRSAHQALRNMQNVLWAKRLYWVIDLDIQKYFDSIPHSHLRAILDQRVTDGAAAWPSTVVGCPALAGPLCFACSSANESITPSGGSFECAAWRLSGQRPACISVIFWGAHARKLPLIRRHSAALHYAGLLRR